MPNYRAPPRTAAPEPRNRSAVRRDRHRLPRIDRLRRVGEAVTHEFQGIAAEQQMRRRGVGIDDAEQEAAGSGLVSCIEIISTRL